MTEPEVRQWGRSPEDMLAVAGREGPVEALTDDELLAVIDVLAKTTLWGEEIHTFVDHFVVPWQVRTGREWFPPGAKRRPETEGRA